MIPDDNRRTAAALAKLARDHLHLGDYRSAARSSEEALSIMQTLCGAGDPDLLPFLDNLSRAYVELGRYELACECVGRAQAIAEANFGPEDVRIVPVLQTIDLASRAVGRFREAHEAAERALRIQRRAFGEQSMQVAGAMGRLAAIIAHVGDVPRAQAMLQTALAMLRGASTSDRKIASEIATTLTNLAGSHLNLGQLEAARPLYEEALALRRSLSGGAHPEIARVLSHLGLLHCQLGDARRAIDVWEESLWLRRRTLGTVHPDVARSLIEIASLQRSLRDPRSAVRGLLEALAILGCYEVTAVTAQAYFLLATIVERDALAAAILFAKLSVNALQNLRAGAARLDPALDRTFVDAREHAYRLLGDGLIVSSRLPEGQQVLGMLKETELFDIVHGKGALRVTRASLTPLESHWSGRGDAIRMRMKEHFERAANDRSWLAEGEPASALDRALADSVGEMQAWLNALVPAFARIDDPSDRDQRRPPLGAAHTASSLGERMPAGTALLQYLLTPDHLSIVLTAPRLLQHHEIPLSDREVNRLVYAMRTELQDGGSRFLASARRLHELMIDPVIADLRAVNARTLALSLDGVMRYLPIAALHDGTRYLVDEFALVLTAGPPGAGERRPVTSDLRVAGLGVAAAVSPGSRLDGVRAELEAVIWTEGKPSGILPGIIHLNEQFTRAALQQALATPYPVIHIASHFTFRAAQEASSYLLLGDGTTLTLADLAQLRFDGVELIVLSACDTATGGGHRQSGREIEGLGAIVRRQGARNVIATLWPVRDFTTATLMRRFYENWCRRALEPAEALRQAQLSFRTCAAGAAPSGPSRALIDPDDQDGGGAWNHPRFWAPYLLMGEAWTATRA